MTWWSEWVGSLDGRPTMWVTRLFDRWGWRIDLHKFVGCDDEWCYHTHPAWALRVILWGGYVEEVEGVGMRHWPPGRVGIVRPSLSHRVTSLRNGPAYTLWVRGPKVARIELHGPGWPREMQPTMGAVVVPHSTEPV